MAEDQATTRVSIKDNTIYVGDKPFMNYVTAIVMQFTTHDQTQVYVRARGKYISRAVDVAEMIIKRFLNNHVKIAKITTDSEEIENREGRQVRVSTIDIALERI